jgi:hypothetical protein
VLDVLRRFLAVLQKRCPERIGTTACQLGIYHDGRHLGRAGKMGAALDWETRPRV